MLEETELPGGKTSTVTETASGVFATWFQSSHSLDRNNVWVIGYSGGAEMIGFELNADRQTTWRTGAASWSVEVTQTVCKLPQRKPLKPSPWTGTSVSGMKLASAGLLTGQHLALQAVGRVSKLVQAFPRPA